ncbi:MAG: 4Fe-4S binding protein [Treponema sp.]
MAEKIYKHRHAVQIISMLVYNADVRNWFKGTISRAPTKNVCVPGLNCYSCPGAIASCPLGSLQSTISNGKFPFFITGFLLLIGTFLGRAVCAFLCPVGFVQELLYKIPTKKVPKTKTLLNISRGASLAKYVILVLMCVVAPLIIYFRDGIGSPVFCSWICPAGTVSAGWFLTLTNEYLRNAIGFLFNWKSVVAIVLIICSIFIFRPFCKYICPLGAIYSLFNKVAIFGIKVDETKCCHCNACTFSCKMNALKINDRECIRCGECFDKCLFHAITR